MKAILERSKSSTIGTGAKDDDVAVENEALSEWKSGWDELIADIRRPDVPNSEVTVKKEDATSRARETVSTKIYSDNEHGDSILSNESFEISEADLEVWIVNNEIRRKL